MNNDIYCTYMDLERLGFREFSMDAQCSVLKCARAKSQSPKRWQCWLCLKMFIFCFFFISPEASNKKKTRFASQQFLNGVMSLMSGCVLKMVLRPAV
jgi:hypothetical protein